MKIALTGGTGFVGRSIVSRLVGEGHQIQAWKRKSSDLAGLPDSIDWIDGSLQDPESNAPLLSGCDAVVHAALDHQPGRFGGGRGRTCSDSSTRTCWARFD